MNDFIKQPVAEFDQPLVPQNNTTSFIYTNALLQSSKEMATPLLHFWTLEKTVILGLKDQRLPHLDQALKVCERHGYHYFLRNSGGLAVISDDGILNFSLFFPWHLEKRQLTIDEAYERMITVIKAAFPELQIETGEVTHSYCPGTFDVHVNGQKIGGISQRRNMDGVVVMLYLGINGPQMTRGELVRDFYDAGLGDEENKWHFPDVWPTSMTTISSLLGHEVTVADAKQRLRNVFPHHQQAKFDQLMWQANFIKSLNDERIAIGKLQQRLSKEN
ncbi:lipoate--protein ligase family protein [Limosilactobacillus avium]|uniref:lipoate--protein ligase family protein n=1 Tax=Limosilactobacillus avium TaxID=2991831 RepID=UPI0024B8DDF5|nr:lipoate--protein ligase family protein [Limosilactobacillus avium]